MKKKFLIATLLLVTMLAACENGNDNSSLSSYDNYDYSSSSYSSYSSSSNDLDEHYNERCTKDVPSYNDYDSYDNGYDDVMENDDYDWNRYYEDDEYASGVDDAIDNYKDEFGEDFE
jgi:hypothetical protein